jgi:hypothetical protein
MSDVLEPGGRDGGEWVEPAVSYVDPVRRFCAYCGRPIARRFWRAREAAYCDPGHAARATYPKRLEPEPDVWERGRKVEPGTGQLR